MSEPKPTPQFKVGENVVEYTFQPFSEVLDVRWNEEYERWEYFGRWQNDQGGAPEGWILESNLRLDPDRPST